EQREALRAKAVEGRPHVLVMTATPIPRTVAMTVFGDLEVTELTELPAGRSPITTHVVPAGEKPHYLERAWQRVREEVAGGGQVSVVCPRIGDEGLAGSADGRAGLEEGAGSAGVGPAGRDGPDGHDGPGGRKGPAGRDARASELTIADDGGFDFAELLDDH